ncbi:hypothetical protein Q3G72_008085 [Acer saccharum]|nr:hypothetical protein Q3G72_008085 [Acer saccharum]
MAGNEWINGYLEAILDSGASAIEDLKPTPVNLTDRGHFNPTKYFVEEVVTGVDETDLHRTWIKVVATRNTRERSSRLENMCWRIWHLTRKKKQLEWEDSQRVAYRRWEREQGRKDVTEDMSEDLSEGEKGDGVAEMVQCETPRKTFQRNLSNLEVWSDDKKEKKLYIVLISLHGLVRGENMELGRDSDTGGQVKYVVELSRALASMPGVYRVDLFTRQISSPEVDWSYGEPTEMLTAGAEDADGNEVGESSGAYIVRIPFGPRDEYLRKELLWPYIQEFVDGALAHILNMSKVLGEQIGGGQPVWPYVIHSHYADAGDSAALLSGALNVPMVLTGHSLGRNKLEQLLKQGRQSKEDINSTYKIMRRIEAEELSLDAAELVITSTKQEIQEQWGLYDGFDVKLEKVLRARARRGVNCHGRYMPRMVVIPPGMDFSNVEVQEEAPEIEGELAALTGNNDGSSPKAVPTIWSELMRFLTNPHKPMILALSRPDPKKNITTLLKAFGECRPLRELANLTLIMGNRDDIEEMTGGNASVLTMVLKMIDKYDLYGQVAYPKHHKQSDVPDIYRLAAKTKGVFINPALVEPFGLTLIEAAAHGLPMVATKNGGPVDIHRALNNGLLVDPHDQQAIADALLKSAVNDTDEWPSKYSKFFVELDDGLELSFTDKRRFAKVRLLNNPASLPPISELGPDALLEPMTVDEFTKSLSKKKLAIKTLLLDQSYISGIGNWIADEVLYQARIHPLQTSASLSKESCTTLLKCIKEVIEKAIEVGADSSQFPNNWIFHSREKKPGKAFVDGKKIDFITAGGRTTAYVPELQKLDGVQAAKAVGKPKKQTSKRKGSKDDDEDDGTDEPESDREENPENVKTKKGGKSGGRGKIPSKRRKSEETDDEDGDDDDIGDEDEVPKTRSRNLTKNKQGEAVKTSKEKGISQKRKSSKTKGTYCLSDYLPSHVKELWEY